VGIGEALAGARGQAGLTVAEVSQRTRIRETVIRGIEGDDYSACGGDFYARGNIRSIAKAVGADPEPLVAEYDAVYRDPGVLSAVSLDELPTRALAQTQAPGRRRPNWAAVLGLALVAAAGFVGYTFLTGSPHAGSAPPAAASYQAAHAGRSRALSALARGAPVPRLDRPAAADPSPRHTAVARARMGPAATVRAYIAAINGHRYARAWRLGGQNAGGSYPSFVSGFSGTAQDTLTIMSVSDGVVTARLSAQQTDGTVDTYQGTYTVQHGVIIGFDVIQVG
jgi:cytoskeletal protein RodZ